MNGKFFVRLAGNNIIKNRRFYIPYFFMSCFAVILMFAVSSIITNPDIIAMKHSDVIITLLQIGLRIVQIFAVIFIFYINSFLIKRRKKELGLFHILGMEKRHIGIVMFFEVLFVSFASIGFGLALGIITNKLLFLILYKLVGADTLPRFYVSGKSIIEVTVFFAVLFFVTFLYNLYQVGKTKTIDLLHGGEMGEREPKTKLLLAIIGVVFIGAGYGFALFEDSPLKALNLFMLAVISVIIGTYALFTAGSIVIIKAMKKNKKFYYQPKHFSAISGMLYRMKQNAVGLANICILSTMVMITVASTLSMYAGMNDILTSSYPNEINVNVMPTDVGQVSEIEQQVAAFNQEYHAEVSDYTSMLSRGNICTKQQADQSLEIEKVNGNIQVNMDAGKYVQIMLIDVDDFNKMHGTDYRLGRGEILCYQSNGAPKDELVVREGEIEKRYTIKETLKKRDLSKKMSINTAETWIPCCLVVMEDVDAMQDFYHTFYPGEPEENGLAMSILYDTDLSVKDSMILTEAIEGFEANGYRIWAVNQHDVKVELTRMYGSFLFMGILFGTLFLIAAVIIIYYKQITEGYEDRERFLIMQKVGMSLEEVKTTIRSQIRMIFLLPILVAGIHVAASFRIIKIILNLLSLGSNSLFLICTIITFVAFLIVYAAVFSFTAKTYYKIVRMEE